MGNEGANTQMSLAVTVTSTSQISGTASLSATPLFGAAPLVVSFQGSGTALTSGANISFGDGTNSGEGRISAIHTYSTPGTYTATLHKDGAKGEVVARTTISVSAPGSGQTNPVTIYSFSASPSTVTSGQSVTFSWNSNLSSTDIDTYGGFCGIEGKPTSGNATFHLQVPKQASGSLTYTPSESATYLLRCSSGGKDGSPSAQKSIYVSVAQPLPSCSITSNKASYALGENITFSWTSTNATSAGFVPDTSGKDNLWVPGDKFNATGSWQTTANVYGNPYVTLKVVGIDNQSATCSRTVNVY
jgi:PKD repeat protein